MSNQKGPALAALVRAGDQQSEAVAITDFIFQVNDISNLYLINTQDGDVLINTGFPDNADHNVQLLASKRSGPLRHIILTQSHADHFGGLTEFKEASTKVIGGAGFTQAWDDMKRLQPFFGPRSAKLWGSTLRRGSAPKAPPEPQPDLLVADRHSFEQGGRRFEMIHAPEGETVDGLIVWMPDEKIAFTGNLVGPMWLSMPFFCTLRGDKPRRVWNTISSLEKLRALDAEMIITGHGDPIHGRDQIRADIDRMIGAIRWVRDYTLQGMNDGKTVHQLMREARLPDQLTIGEFHGKLSWAVKTIWEEYAGWFHYEDGTTALYGVPQSDVHADLVELAGASAIAERARAHVSANRSLEALHLTDILLNAAPDHADALRIKIAALEQILLASGSRNLSETMWLRSEIADAQGRLGGDIKAN